MWTFLLSQLCLPVLWFGFWFHLPTLWTIVAIFNDFLFHEPSAVVVKKVWRGQRVNLRRDGCMTGSTPMLLLGVSGYVMADEGQDSLLVHWSLDLLEMASKSINYRLNWTII